LGRALSPAERHRPSSWLLTLLHRDGRTAFGRKDTTETIAGHTALSCRSLL